MPGPGNYSPDSRAMKSAAPSYGFGKDSRRNGDAGKVKIPGPGSYSIPGVIGNDGPSKTLGGGHGYSPELKENSGKPGPGHYDGNSLITKKQNPRFKMGTSMRMNLS